MLADIRNILRIRAVVANGRYFDAPAVSHRAVPPRGQQRPALPVTPVTLVCVKSDSDPCDLLWGLRDGATEATAYVSLLHAAALRGIGKGTTPVEGRFPKETRLDQEARRRQRRWRTSDCWNCAH